jgi:hypothetical protein
VTALALLPPIAVLLAIGMKLSIYRRDRLGSLLLIALPMSAVVLTAAIIAMVAQDWEASTDCVDGCQRAGGLQFALDTAEIALYAFAGLLVAAVVRWLVLLASQRPRSSSA